MVNAVLVKNEERINRLLNGERVRGWCGIVLVMYLVLIAAVVIIPIAYYIITEWMGNFAYRTELNYFTFIAVAAIAMLFAFLTVAFHSLRTARMNPVQSLKYE